MGQLWIRYPDFGDTGIQATNGRSFSGSRVNQQLTAYALYINTHIVKTIVALVPIGQRLTNVKSHAVIDNLERDRRAVFEYLNLNPTGPQMFGPRC